MGQKFIVHKTNLMDPKNPDPRKKIGHGQVIELDDPKVIRKFSKLGYLRPYIEDEEPDDEDDDEDDDDAAVPAKDKGPAKPVGAGRAPA